MKSSEFETDPHSDVEADAVTAEINRILARPATVAPVVIAPDNPVVFAHYDELVGTLDNVRETLVNVRGMKASIIKHGLLENLVGIEIPEAERQSKKGWIEIIAGCRRLAALGELRQEGSWPKDRLIPVTMRDSRGFWENLVENVEREDVEPWDIGRKLSEASSSGLTHRDIGMRIGRTQGWVTRHIHIGTGLAPDAVVFIKTNKLKLPIGELYRLSFLRDPYGDPDAEGQIAALSKRRRRKPPVARDKDSLRAFSNRINYLKTQMPVPPLLRPIVGGVIEYLEGGGRPNFRQLAEKIMGERRRLLGEEDDA
jgi:hypothetical protein